VRCSATVVMQACVTVPCSVLQCVAVCCSILQRVAFRCSATIVRQMCVRMCKGGGGEGRVRKKLGDCRSSWISEISGIYVY